jgi:hypothetical protein
MLSGMRVHPPSGPPPLRRRRVPLEPRVVRHTNSRRYSSTKHKGVQHVGVWKYNGYTGSLAGPSRGPAVGTKGVKRERWRPAKAPAGPADRH